MKNLSSAPLITIGITCYNAQDTIEDAVVSAVSQTWPNKEIICVDDYSTDKSLDILEQLRQKYDINILTNSKNCGVASARNRIIRSALGDFIAFFDDDDVSEPERLHLQFDRIVNYENRYNKRPLVICHTARLINYPGGRQRLEPTVGVSSEEAVPVGAQFLNKVFFGTRLNNGNGSCATCSQMARRATYLNVGGFDPFFLRSEDTEFNVRLASMNGHFVGLSEPLVMQRMTKTSDKSLLKEGYYFKKVLQKHKDKIQDERLFEFVIRWLDLKKVWLERNRLIFLYLLFRMFITHPFLTIAKLWTAAPNYKGNRYFRMFHNDA